MKLQNLIATFLFVTLPIFAASEGSPTKDSPKITIELNKLDQSKENCITYFIVHNQTSNSFTEFKTEFIIFNKKDIIESIILGDFKKIPPGKTVVKPFGIPKITCKNIGKILINDVRQCKIGDTEKTNCLSLLQPSNKSTTELFK